MSIVFARPRWDYHSYRDLWRLVETSGFPLIYIDEIDPTNSETCYILSTPDASHEWGAIDNGDFQGARAKIIFWMIEWYLDYTLRPGVVELWHPDAQFAAKIGARFVPVGSDAGLAPDWHNGSKEYDIIHLQYLVPRRADVIRQLKTKGIAVAENCWDDERHKRLVQSRAMLHIHQHADIPALAPLRTALAAAYRLPLFSETHWETPHIPHGCVVSAGLDTLADGVARVVKSEQTAAKGYWLHEVLCNEWQFGKVVEASV